MNSSLSIFDETARVGDAILDALAGQPTAARYLDKVAEIYFLLAQIHDLVATAAVQASLATTTDQANAAIQGVSRQALTDAFRAQKWCDELEDLGHALRPLGNEVNVTNRQRKAWDDFCRTLEEREGEVARLYDTGLYDLNALAWNPLPLATLRQKADAIATQLVVQKAQFDLLVKKALAMRAQV